ncbi:MAG: TatD family hydrolase [Betaproteobacteria bacterium]|nr:TatD family hydrolase [Betaproteobacteria bacterium]
MFTDSHCHLTFPDLASQIPSIQQAMAEAQVHQALCICTTIEEFDAVHALALNHANLFATVGVHPDNEDAHEPSADDLRQRAMLSKVVGVGETGLDYYRLNGRTVADMAWQRDRFRVHIQVARETALPLVVHTRAASDDTLAILKEQGEDGSDGSAGGVFHCFTETMAVARAALDLGFYISFSGILTFKNAEDIREVARFVPLDRMLIETDSPYLSPMPYRGKTNSPAYVPWVAKRIAEIRGMTVEDIGALTTQNFESLFSKVLAS